MVGDIIMRVSLRVLIRTVCTAALPFLLLTASWQVLIGTASRTTPSARYREVDVAHSHFQHRIVVPGSVLRQIQICGRKCHFLK